MPNIADLAARGKIVEVRGDVVVLQPLGTTYQLHLQRAGDARIELTERPVDVIIRVRGRKVWTVPSGGLFIAPIFGPPRIVQGRVRHLDEHEIVVNAGTMVIVELPAGESAYDLANGPIEVGVMVNVTALPGATIELLSSVTA